MIDKLSLTLDILPDVEYLNNHGQVIEDKGRHNLYKYLCKMDDRFLVFFLPHKFGDVTNARMPVTKIDVNPKYFSCYAEMVAHLSAMFEVEVKEDNINCSRIDIAVDVEGISTDGLLSMVRISRIRAESLSFFKGTIYAGSNPKIRIYNKVEEIKARFKRGADVTDYERRLAASGKIHTRFEVQIRLTKKTLKDIANDPAGFASHFDRLQMFDFGDKDETGVLQVRYKYINRKLRAELEQYRNFELVRFLKEKYIDEVSEWFNPDIEPF